MNAARWLARSNLALLAAGFAWFAYIDAPITDAAMWLFAAAVLAGLLSVVAALVSGEVASPVAGTRWRRATLLLFMAALALMLTAATVTLNLKGTGSEATDTEATVTHA